MQPHYEVKNMFVNKIIKRLCYKINGLSAWISNINYDYNYKIIGYTETEKEE
tara:strand:- start:624 stop:779 length:156 start_codon:yes stop_codon:yes gene_type:complete